MEADMFTETTDDVREPVHDGVPAAPVGRVGVPAGATRVTEPSVLDRVDVTRVLVTAEVVAGAVVVAYRLARRPSAPRARVTMGPGGWVSMKGGAVSVRPASRPFGRSRRVTATQPDERAPLWARVLSAVPLQTLGR
jgi:hypothetical protein